MEPVRRSGVILLFHQVKLVVTSLWVRNALIILCHLDRGKRSKRKGRRVGGCISLGRTGRSQRSGSLCTSRRSLRVAISFLAIIRAVEETEEDQGSEVSTVTVLFIYSVFPSW